MCLELSYDVRGSNGLRTLLRASANAVKASPSPHRRFKSRLSFLARLLTRLLRPSLSRLPSSRLKERWDGCACSQRRKMRRKEEGLRESGEGDREGCGRKHYTTYTQKLPPSSSASYACSLGACSSASAQQSRLSPSRVPSFFDPIQAVRVSVFSRLRDSDKTGFNVE